MPVTITPATIDSDRLKSYVTRIENLEETKRETAEDIKDVYTEVKSAGLDTKIVRKVIKLRRMDKDARDEQETLLDIYMRALGN